eukprot:gene17833-24217_t
MSSAPPGSLYDISPLLGPTDQQDQATAPGGHGFREADQQSRFCQLGSCVGGLASTVAGGDRDYGLFVADGKSVGNKKRWWWPFGGGSTPPLAQFPLSSAITAGNVLSTEIGKGFSWMIKQGLVDERTIIIAYLALEKARGGASLLSPWINVLPKEFHTPLYFTTQELQELRGTTLYHAAAAIKGRLKEQWDKLEPSLNVIAQATLVYTDLIAVPPSRNPTFEDLLWAHSVFWSRGQALPIPKEGTASKAVAASKAGGVSVDPSNAVHVVDAIVPGLDFANHHVTAPPCWWEVVVPPKPSQVEVPTKPSQVEVSPKPSQVEESQEAKGSEDGDAVVQLKLYKGGNPNDSIMIAPPIPPSSTWDDTMQARMGLLRNLGLSPQMFFYRSSLPSATPSLTSPASAQKRGKGAKTPRYACVIPEEVLDVLEVFVLDLKEVDMRLRLLASREEGAEVDSKVSPLDSTVPVLGVNAIDERKEKLSRDELVTHSKRLGLRMAALSVLVGKEKMSRDELITHSKRLGLRMAALSVLVGEEGAEVDSEVSPLDSAVPVLGVNAIDERKEKMSRDELVTHSKRLGLRMAALSVFVGQKRLAREYFVQARAEMNDTLQLMRELEDLIRASS